MVGVHALIGIGEGLISGLVVSAVLVARPDLVVGARVAGFRGSGRARVSRVAVGGFVAAGVAVAVFLLAVVAPRASSSPDGLERVALDHGIAGVAVDSATADSPLAGYGVAGMGSAPGTILAGLAGLTLVFGVGAAVTGARARRRDVEKEVAA